MTPVPVTCVADAVTLTAIGDCVPNIDCGMAATGHCICPDHTTGLSLVAVTDVAIPGEICKVAFNTLS